jgi:hypothetical protein
MSTSAWTSSRPPALNTLSTPASETAGPGSVIGAPVGGAG